MASKLTKDALIHLQNDSGLRIAIAPFIDIDLEGIKSAAQRGSKALTSYYAVLAIAESMGKTPDEILEDEPKLNNHE